MMVSQTLLELISTAAGQLGPIDEFVRWLFSFSSKQVQTLAAVGSLLVSVGILFVYMQQIKLKRIEQRPIINAEGYRQYDSDSLTIEVKNYGRGSATKLGCRTVVAPIDVSKPENIWQRVGLVIKSWIPKSASTWTKLRPVRKMEDGGSTQNIDEWQQSYRPKLAPDEKCEYQLDLSLKTKSSIIPDRLLHVWHQYRAWLPGKEDSRPNTHLFGTAIEELDTRDQSEISGPPNVSELDYYRIRASVNHKNAAGEAGTETIFDYVVPAIDGYDLSDTLEVGMPYEQFKDNRQIYEVHVLETTQE